MAGKTVLDTHNVVSAEELYDIINMQLDEIERSPESADSMAPILMHGSPGLGKSSIVKSVCADRGIDFVDVRLSQMEPCDIKGLPVPDRENKTMEWFVNGSWPRDPNGKGVIFLDEITSADRSIQVAAYELVLDRRLGKLYEVPHGYLIVAAGNNATDRAVACSMSSALANRFTHVELRENAEDWLIWGRSNDLHPSVLGFISYMPNRLFNMEDENLERGWPSPRSWERVSRLCHMYKGKSDTLLRKMVYGTVGNRAGVEFMEFYKLNSEFDDVLRMMTDPDADVVIPEKVDRRYALCSAMTYLLWKGKTEEEENKRIDGFFRICMKLSSDFAAMTFIAAYKIKDAAESKRRSAKLVYHPMFKEWKNKHGAALSKRMKV